MKVQLKNCNCSEVALTGSLDCDADSVNTLVIHFLDGFLGGARVLELDEGVSSLEREFCDFSILLEFVLEVFWRDFTLESTDVNLST